jgi:hypothetical protein
VSVQPMRLVSLSCRIGKLHALLRAEADAALSCSSLSSVLDSTDLSPSWKVTLTEARQSASPERFRGHAPDHTA